MEVYEQLCNYCAKSKPLYEFGRNRGQPSRTCKECIKLKRTPSEKAKLAKINKKWGYRAIPRLEQTHISYNND